MDMARYAIAVAALIAIILAGPAHAQPGSLSKSICDTLDEHPSISALLTTIKAVESYGLDQRDALIMVAASIHIQCPRHSDLLLQLKNILRPSASIGTEYAGAQVPYGNGEHHRV